MTTTPAPPTASALMPVVPAGGGSPAARPPTPQWQRILRWLMTAGGFAFLGWLLFVHIGVDQLGAALRRIGLGAVLVVLALGWVENLVDCEALRRSMLGRVKYGWTVVASGAGGFVNTIIPFEAGEVVKAALLRQHSTNSRVVSGLVIWNYVWKLAKPAALAVFFLAALSLGHVFPRNLHWPVAAGVALCFVPYVALRILLHQRPAERLLRLLSRVPRLSKKAASWVAAGTRLDEEVRDFHKHHRRAYLQVLGLTFVGRFVSVPGVQLLLEQVGLPSDYGSVLFLIVASAVWDYALMLVPARVGVSEGGVYLLYQFLGLDPAAAIALSIVGRVRSLVVSGPSALIAAFSMRRPAPPPPSADQGQTP